MKITFPHMGNMSLAVKALLEQLDLDVIVPPPITKKTLNLGISHSPEFACLPLKINMGNFIQAAEMGADTVVMSGGVGPCRFGYYAQVEREILRDLGYDYNFIVIEPPDTSWRELHEKIRILGRGKSLWQVAGAIRFAWQKSRVADVVEIAVQKIRPREVNQGDADRIYRRALAEIDRSQDKATLFKAERRILEELAELPQDREKPVIKVAVIGEIYTILEPFVNQNLEANLGRLGVEVSRSIYLSEWINDHLFYGLARIRSSKEYIKAAPPYLCHFVGGHGQETVGSAVTFAREGFDGALQLAPLTCMPEIVAQSVLPLVSEKEAFPVMTIYFDEQSGEAGLCTRLEAFTDLLWRRFEMKRSGNHERILGS